jgi:hypothetical protein
MLEHGDWYTVTDVSEKQLPSTFRVKLPATQSKHTKVGMQTFTKYRQLALGPDSNSCMQTASLAMILNKTIMGIVLCQ